MPTITTKLLSRRAAAGNLGAPLGFRIARRVIVRASMVVAEPTTPQPNRCAIPI
jgi:hypothetical protein